MQCKKRIFVAPMHRELEFIVPLTEFYITCPKCNQEVDSAIYDEHMQGHEDQASNTEEGTSNPSPRPGPSSDLEEATSSYLELEALDKIKNRKMLVTGEPNQEPKQALPIDSKDYTGKFHVKINIQKLINFLFIRQLHLMDLNKLLGN